MNIIDVTKNNVTETGFFCKMSQKKSEGYKRKLNWVNSRFDEGLHIKMLDLKQNGRGFIEYIPGEYAWRAVNAEGFMFIHCLWVVGQSKGKGYAKLLLDECIKDAKKQKMNGVAMLTSEGNWLVSKQIFERAGFVAVDHLSPFDLMVLNFKKYKAPSFPKNFEEKINNYDNGFTVIRTDQCPYLDDATNTIKAYANKKKIDFKEVELKTAKDVREKSPSPYGVFSIVYNKKLLSHHYLLPRDIEPKIAALE
jgi:ribosomal protein S18 acetylase RimI-like enzyme